MAKTAWAAVEDFDKVKKEMKGATRHQSRVVAKLQIQGGGCSIEGIENAREASTCSDMCTVFAFCALEATAQQ